VTDTNVIRLAQPGPFANSLTEILRNGARALLTQHCCFRSRYSRLGLFCSSAARLLLLPALLPVTAHADIIGPNGGSQRPQPPPLIFVVGPKVMEEIHKAGFDCPLLEDVVEKARPGDNPGTYVDLHLIPLTVTCQNGKKFFVTLPYKAEDPGGSVLPLD